MIWPRLVFVSGWAGDAACWRDVVAALSPPAPPQFVSGGACVLDQGRTLDAAIQGDPGQVVLVGWSIGAMLSLQAVARIVAGGLGGLVLISGTPRLVNPRVLRAMGMQLRRQREKVLADFARLCIVQGTSEPEAGNSDFIARFLEMAGRIETEELAAGLQYLRDTDLRLQLSRIAMPVAVVHGQGRHGDSLRRRPIAGDGDRRRVARPDSRTPAMRCRLPIRGASPARSWK